MRMPIPFATAIAYAVTAYLTTGLVFVALVLPRLVLRLDDGLRGAPVTVRALIAPGLVLLWPLFLARLVTRAAPGEERNAHRQAVHGHGRGDEERRS